MPDEIDLTQFGGVRQIQAGADPNDPSSITWNFGVLDPIADDQKTPLFGFYERFPNLQGRWDGKQTINHHDAVRKVLGSNLPAHNQPRGTCGGRAGSRTLELLQCILIASGKRAKYKPVSHAWLYYLARKKYNMLRGGDGVPGGSVEEIMDQGILHREECGDTKYAGQGSDDLAVAWGGGRLSGDELRRFEEMARDNPVTARTKVSSFAEAADAIASGGIIIRSDNQGFTMTRDQDGFCRPQGSWAHYHTRSGVRAPNGKKGIQYDQSWGDTTPGGPLVDGCPGNVFLIDEATEDRNIKRGSAEAIFGFSLWDLDNGNFDIDWAF